MLLVRGRITFVDLRDNLDSVVLGAADEALDVVQVVFLQLLALSPSYPAQFSQFPGEARLDSLQSGLHDVYQVICIGISKILLERSCTFSSKKEMSRFVCPGPKPDDLLFLSFLVDHQHLLLVGLLVGSFSVLESSPTSQRGQNVRNSSEIFKYQMILILMNPDRPMQCYGKIIVLNLKI